MTTTKRIIAKFYPQAWQNDYAISVDPEGPTEWDVTYEILLVRKDRALAIQDDRADSDALRFTPNAPQWVKDWSGPFFIEVEESIAAYFETKDGMEEYRVTLHEDRGDKHTIVFDCHAEDGDHAAEQALNAYPNGEVINTTIKRLIEA